MNLKGITLKIRKNAMNHIVKKHKGLNENYIRKAMNYTVDSFKSKNSHGIDVICWYSLVYNLMIVTTVNGVLITAYKCSYKKFRFKANRVYC